MEKEQKKIYQEDIPLESQIKECEHITDAILLLAQAFDSLKNSTESKEKSMRSNSHSIL